MFTDPKTFDDFLNEIWTKFDEFIGRMKRSSEELQEALKPPPELAEFGSVRAHQILSTAMAETQSMYRGLDQYGKRTKEDEIAANTKSSAESLKQLAGNLIDPLRREYGVANLE